MKRTFIMCILSLNTAISILPVAAQEAGYPPETGWEAFNELTRGNQRFRKARELNPRRTVMYRDGLAQAQPHTAIVTCSDSRVMPEIIMDQGFGDLFVVRTLGLALGSTGRASIEYAVGELGVKFLLLLASDSCIGLKAAFERKGDRARSPSVDQRELFNRLWRQTYDRSGIDPHAAHFDSTVKAASHGAMKELIESSDIINKAVLDRKLLLGLASFNLITGKISFWKVGYPSIVDNRIKWTQPGGAGFNSPGSMRDKFK